MGVTKWFEGVAPLTVKLPNGHRVTWRRGKLVLEDHDLGAERVMVALGADACLCLDVLEAWRVGREEGRPPGGLWPPYDLDRVREQQRALRANMDANLKMAQASTSFGYRPPGQSPSYRLAVERMRLQLDRRWRSALWGAVPIELRDRFTLTALVTRARDPVQPDVDPDLTEAVAPALVESMRAWRRGVVLPRVDVQVAAHGEQPSVTGHLDDHAAMATAVLPLMWVAQVAAWGLAVVDGCFVLEVLERSDERHVVSALRWEREGRMHVPRPVPAVILKSGGAWRLRFV